MSEELIEEFDPTLDHSFDGEPNEDYTDVVQESEQDTTTNSESGQDDESAQEESAQEEQVEDLNYQSSFTYRRINNDSDVDVSYPTIRYEMVSEHGEPETLKPVFDITNATLKARFYDATVISFGDSLGTRVSEPEDLCKFSIKIMECIGEDRKTIEFNLGTRKPMIYDPVTGRQVQDDEADPIREAVFYDPSFALNEETGRYELTVYVGAKCGTGSNVFGFNDSEVFVELIETDEHPSATLRYRAILPPFILQSLPEKCDSAADPVIPDGESRADYGYDPDTGEYTIAPYKQNAYGFDRDFMFTNSDPLYKIVTSGFMPNGLGDYDFSGFEASLVNDKTGSKYSLRWSEDGVSSDSLDVIKWAGDDSFCAAQFDIKRWTLFLVGDPEFSGVGMNTVTVSATVREPDINN